MSDILNPDRNLDRRRAILATARTSLAVTGTETSRKDAVADRLSARPKGVIPRRGQVDHAGRVSLFEQKVDAASATFARLETPADIPAAIADYLRQHNLPPRIRHGDDARLNALPWQDQKTLEVSTGIAEDATLVGVSHAFAGIAETGTLVMTSGPDNPTTLNFLPENHIVVLNARDIAGDYETVLERVRAHFGTGAMPRTVNMITGPSRSGDIEQTLIMGAHGPRQLHILVVDAPSG